MLSKYIEQFDKNHPLNEYPRPQLIRKSYLNLNGTWDFKISNNHQLPTSYDQTIIVPYCVESVLSNINERVLKNQFLYYRKTFVYDKAIANDQLILHIDACDQLSEVYINNNLVITHDLGYLPIIINIKPYVTKGENEIVICVIDTLDKTYPYGKQCDNNKGMWYTPCSGIWQSVWLEGVSDDYISMLTITPDIDSKKVRLIINSKANSAAVKIFENDKVIYNEKSELKIFEINIDNMILWTPDNPFLYKITIKTKNDEVSSYFAMRKFSCNDNYFLLNNKPYFINGVLDQGYFPDGIYTPSSYLAYEDDILTMKRLGFNCLRKHIKIEPLRFYYYCDLYGMIVIQDIVNNGQYSFFKQTVLPTIGLKNISDKNKNISEKQKSIYKKSLLETIKYLYNVPCIAIYTLFNEGWGQHDSDEYYKIVKDYDSTRLIDSTSGWFKANYSDFESLHIYFKKIKLNNILKNKPIIISEFGGYSYRVNNHVYSKNEYGYKSFKDEKSYNDGIIKLYEEIIDNLSYPLAGCIYTQLSDVEDETNGFLTYDRKVLKINEEKIKKLNERIYEVFYHE
ncbi:MAG: glycoside hydrolase family 2 [Erysipelotrichaceae bacterium]|nr:glycoside hydrolase family 2 [Erysipelotrichaceae bacterium]